MTIDAYKHQIEARPTPTARQYADAWTYVSTHAPDLLEAIFGGAS